ncbi:MAG: Rieske 2Fe-2S domain-containing protein [Prochloraceae cyanobacterium]
MKKRFNWFKNWYPVSPIDYLEKKKPNTIELLNKKLVVWKNYLGDWIVMDDICPHKLVELSKGKIDLSAENIVCRYHGWHFNSSGKCTQIPAFYKEDFSQKNICEDKQAMVKTYPSLVSQDLLWIWPDNSPVAEIESKSSQPAIMPEDLVDISDINWYMTEVPIGYAISVENTFDPFHAPFVHENENELVENKIFPIKQYELISEISSEGFTLKQSGFNNRNKDIETKRKFVSPCSNTVVYNFPNGQKKLFQVYFIPTKPGYCKTIVQLLPFTNLRKKTFWQRFLPEDLVIGLQHISFYKMSDQDLNILNSQEAAYSKIDQSSSEACYLPTTSDVGSKVFRNWLEEFAGGEPFKKETHFEVLSDEKLYERWHKHSKFCPHCRNSLKILEKIRIIADWSSRVLGLLSLITLLISMVFANNNGIFFKIALLLAILTWFCFWFSIYLEDKKHLFLSSIPKHKLPEIQLY